MNKLKLKPIKKLQRNDDLITKSWIKEDTYRYVFEYPDKKIVETSMFVHYCADNSVNDITIEVSSMHGCPLKCKFCDTAKINNVKFLNSFEIYAQINQIISETKINPSEYKDFRVSFLAIGENSLIPEIIVDTMKQVQTKYTNVSFNLSTIVADLDAFSFWASKELALRTFQISLLHYDINRLKSIVPNIQIFDLNKIMLKAVGLKNNHPNIKIRLNYVLIKDFNDSIEYLNSLLEILEPFRNDFYFRLSILNQTSGTFQNCLSQVDEKQTTILLSEIKRQGFDAYIFGTFNDIQISCGQFIGDYK